MKSISLLHPFTAQAIGLEEEDLYHSHSKAQELALQNIQEQHTDYQVSIDYFTGKWLPHQKQIKNLKKQFWPVTHPLVKKRHQWRIQESFWHYKHQQKHPTDLTIINMSGHGSKYTFQIAQLITQLGLPYIPMVGGIHMSTNEKAFNYYRNAHHILVHTQVQKDNLKKLEGFKELDIRVLPLGVNQKLFQPKGDISSNSQTIKLLQVGRVSRLKQMEHSIQLVKFLKEHQLDVQLEIIGFPSDLMYKNKLLTLIEQFNLKKEIYFAGSLAQEELVKHYQHSDLLLMPSQHESFGMVMVEAMACGCPVVGYKGAGGTDELIEDGINGLLVTPEILHDAVMKLITDKVYLQQLKMNAVEVVNKKWSIEVTTRVLEKSIEDGLGY